MTKTLGQLAMPDTKSSNGVLSPRLEIGMARQTHRMASYFRLSGKELDHVAEVPAPVQTSAEIALQFTVVRHKSFCCYDFPSSNPVATLGKHAFPWKSPAPHDFADVSSNLRRCVGRVSDEWH